jgi:hypothetical protein
LKNPRNAGRKPKYGVPTSKMSLHVPEPINTRLSDEATRRGTTKSEVVIQALDAALPGGPDGAVAGVADAFD